MYTVFLISEPNSLGESFSRCGTLIFQNESMDRNEFAKVEAAVFVCVWSQESHEEVGHGAAQQYEGLDKSSIYTQTPVLCAPTIQQEEFSLEYN